MKKVFVSLAACALASLPLTMRAQDKIEEKVEKKERVEKKEKVDKKIEKKETQEIIIRNKGEKDLNLKVEINGDKVTVNGKPLEEFKDDQVSINNRKMIIRDGEDAMSFDLAPFQGQWEGREITKPFLGVTTEKVAEGAKITDVVDESAAEKAGLKKGDIITKVGDEPISSADKLSEVITSRKAKDLVTVTYLRNGKQETVKATLGKRKVPSPALAFTYPGGKVRSFVAPRIQSDRLREQSELLREQGLNDQLNSLNEGYMTPYVWGNTFSRQMKLGLKIQDTEEGGNVKVINVEEGSAAEKAGLKKDDIITEINGEKIDNTDDAREQLMPDEEKSSYNIKAKRNGTEMTFEVKFPKKLKTADL